MRILNYYLKKTRFWFFNAVFFTYRIVIFCILCIAYISYLSNFRFQKKFKKLFVLLALYIQMLGYIEYKFCPNFTVLLVVFIIINY